MLVKFLYLLHVRFGCATHILVDTDYIGTWAFIFIHRPSCQALQELVVPGSRLVLRETLCEDNCCVRMLCFAFSSITFFAETHCFTHFSDCNHCPQSPSRILWDFPSQGFYGAKLAVASCCQDFALSSRYSVLKILRSYSLTFVLFNTIQHLSSSAFFKILQVYQGLQSTCDRNRLGQKLALRQRPSSDLETSVSPLTLFCGDVFCKPA